MSTKPLSQQSDNGEAIHFDSKEVHALRVALSGNSAPPIALDRAKASLRRAAMRGTGTAAATGMAGHPSLPAQHQERPTGGLS